MSVSSLTTAYFRTVFAVPSLAAILLAAALPASAQGTHLWTQSRFEDFEKGSPQGVELSSDGYLRNGPVLHEKLTTSSTFIWSVAVDKSGTAFVGTASPATVLRIGQDGKPFTLFESKDLSVQVVRLGPDGALYAATLPSGKVFRLKSDATAKQDEASATVIFDASKLPAANKTKPPEAGPTTKAADNAKADDGDKAGTDKPAATTHYIWDMTFDSAGRLYIATGGPAAVYRIDPARPSASPEEFFKTDEQHIRSLTWDAKGNLIAGTDGSGLVYRISPQGTGYVLFEAPRREITAVAVAANGTIYAASVGDKSHNPLPPLPIQGAGSATITIIQPGSLQAVNASASVPEGTDVYALSEGQAPRKIWSSKDDIIYSLAARPDGVIAVTGNRGRVFRIAPDGAFADLAHLEAQQGLGLAETSGNALLIATGNTGKLYSLGTAGDKHEYSSDVLDAGALARFGRIEVEPGSTGYDLWTRSGNVEQPARGRNDSGRSDWGWAAWQQVNNGEIASPPGRFLQWKAVLHAGGQVGSVGVNYLPVNAAPVVDELVVAPGARLNPQNQQVNQPPTVNISFPSAGQGGTLTFDAGAGAPLQAMKDRTAITVRWAAHDDNGDDLTFSLYLRGDGEKIWRLLKDGITDKAYSFDTTLIPDGGYQVKVVASDAPSHTPGDALTGFKESERFEVDTTPPVVTLLKASAEPTDCKGTRCPRRILVTFDAEDAASPLAHAEYSLDAGPWQFVEPIGGLSDSKHEHYEIHLSLDSPASKPSEHLITVRVYDRHDNVGVSKTVIAAEEK
jgi:hypothetical protein